MRNDQTFTKAEAAAAQILRRFGLRDPRELVLEDLAMALGVVVRDAELHGAEARLVRKGDKGLIRVSNSIPEVGRRRFAIAHELGHWSEHKHTSQLNLCLAEDLIGYRGSREELEANAFASHLLLPTSFLRKTYSDAPSLGLIGRVAEELSTSFTATAARFVEVTDDPCLVAFIDEQTRAVQWWRRSDRCPKVWLESRQQIDERTVTSEVLNGNLRTTAPEAVDPNAWFPHVPNHQGLLAYEETMKLGNYPTLVTLLSIARK